MTLKALLFDWDGTLLDSAEACFRVYSRLFAEQGVPFDRQTHERTYSPNWELTYERLLLPRERWALTDARYLELWSNEAIPLRRGAREMVEELDRRGARLGLVTSGERVRVEPEVEKHGLSSRFDTVVCGDDIARKKPDPEGLRLALQRLAVQPREAAYVGDSPEDVEMARRCGVFSVGIDGGFPNHHTLRASRPDVLVDSLEGLLAISGY